MLFERRFWEPIASGEVTATFRRWKRRQVVAGRRYRTAAGMLEVERVEVVDPAAIADDDARRAGYASADDLRADLRGDPGLDTYGIWFHPVDEPDPRAVLAADDDLTDDDVAAIDARLERFDRSSSWGPWTAATLRLIAERPGVRAGELADAMGRQRAEFKLDVRKLKALGLTNSLRVGYELSPRGRAYVGRNRASPADGTSADR